MAGRRLVAVLAVAAVAVAVAAAGSLDQAADVEDAFGALFGMPATRVLPPGARESFELEYLGKNRTYVLYTPTSYNATTPTPLVLNIHGAGSSPYIHVS